MAGDDSRPWSFYYVGGLALQHRSANAEIKTTSTGPPTGCEHGDSLWLAKLGRYVIEYLWVEQMYRWQQSWPQRDITEWQHSVLQPTQISALDRIGVDMLVHIVHYCLAFQLLLLTSSNTCKMPHNSWESKSCKIKIFDTLYGGNSSLGRRLSPSTWMGVIHRV